MPIVFYKIMYRVHPNLNIHHTRNNIKNKKESKEKLWGICKGINKVFFSINKEISSCFIN